MLAAIVLALAASGCKTEGDSGPQGPVTLRYAGETGVVEILLTITEGQYELTVGTKISKGKAEKSTTNNSMWILTPNNAQEKPFTVTVDSVGITKIEGTITYVTGDPDEGGKLGAIEPVPPPKNTLTITGITGLTGNVRVNLSSRYDWIFGDGRITDGSLNVKLMEYDYDYEGEGNTPQIPWGGSGRFFIELSTYYSGGYIFHYTGGTSAIQEYSFSPGQTKIPFNQFDRAFITITGLEGRTGMVSYSLSYKGKWSEGSSGSSVEILGNSITLQLWSDMLDSGDTFGIELDFHDSQGSFEYTRTTPFPIGETRLTLSQFQPASN